MLIIGNWKANGSYSLCKSFIKTFKGNGNVILCPPAVYLEAMVNKISGIAIGAQDCSRFKNGAYTGDISCQLLKDIGIKYVIIGHSERVYLYHETIDTTLDKINRCLENELIPIVCIDDDYLEKMDKLSKFDRQIMIAYEPISSIGTGILPGNDKIESILNQIKSYGQFKTLYGGSVNAKNIDNIKQITSLDGVLVGGASLSVNDFQSIVDTCT
jgi:triosephosphate isomerase